MSELTGLPYCLKYLLFIFNFVFWLLGCTVMGVGIWVRADYVTEHLIRETGFEYYYSACYLVIFTGFLIMFIGFMGCMGALRESPLLLSIHIIFLAIIFILELSAAAYVFSVGLEGTSMDDFLRNTLENGIDQYGYNDKARRMLDTIQSNLYCCGVNNWLDYQNNNKFVPNSCRNEITGRQFDIGCLEKITLFVEQRSGAIGGLSLSICLLQILGIAFSICLCQAVRKEGKA